LDRSDALFHLILCVAFGELISGMFVMVSAIVIAALVGRREVAERRMLRRMRERAEQSSHAHKTS
jgi:hypothetical protein